MFERGTRRLPKELRPISEKELLTKVQQIDVTDDALFDLAGQPYVHDFERTEIGDVRALLEKRRAELLPDAQLALIQQSRQERITRRQAIKKGLKKGVAITGKTVAAVGVTGFVGWGLYEISKPDPHAAEKARAKKEAFENTNTLGLNPSAPSYEQWRIYYPKQDPTVQYKENSVLPTLDENTFIKINNRNTKIAPKQYKRLDGIIMPELVVDFEENNYADRESDKHESWILRDKPTSEIDTSVVVFEDLKTRTPYYLKVALTASDGIHFTISIMEKTSAGN